MEIKKPKKSQRVSINIGLLDWKSIIRRYVKGNFQEAQQFDVFGSLSAPLKNHHK